ncbi:heterodisulfide reductase-related iron-sulfur binding cluster [Desulfoscipio gibsoniae]
MITIKIILFVLLLIFSLYSFGMGIKERYEVLALAKPENRFDQPGQRLLGALGIVLGQRRIMREPGAGFMHLLIFWGLIVFSLGIVGSILEGLFPGVVLPFLGSNPYFYLLIDIFGLMAIVGMLISAYRRYIAKEESLGVGGWAEEKIIVALIAGIVTLVISYYISSGAHAVYAGADRYVLAPITGMLAAFWSGMTLSASQILYEVFWWLNVVLALGLLIFFRYSHLVHPLAAPINIYLRNLQPRGGSIKSLDLENEEEENFGVSKITDYTWKQLLDCFACAECGRCQENCPAYLSGKPLSPKQLIADLKNNLPSNPKSLGKLKEAHATAETNEQTDLPELAGEVISEDVIWSCTTCYACQEHCPQLNEHINKIIDLRRNLVLDRSEFPNEAQLAFTNLERNFNPWGVGWSNRADWADELDVPLIEDNKDAEYLLFVGCAGSFDDRTKNVTTSLVKILKAAGINFAILGSEEKCCGDSARRLGNEYLYQSLVEENIEVLNGYGVKKIITACPHCFNTLKNEYPSFGGNYEVIHHTQLIKRLIEDKKLNLQGEGSSLKLTYHDSCYLGRYNNEYDAPRQIIGYLPGVNLVEMDRNKNRAFCCGAGGGRMWLEEHLGNRINVMRTEQALQTKPDVIAVNCPFCLTMIEDGLKEHDQAEQVQAKDIAELVARYLQ